MPIKSDSILTVNESPSGSKEFRKSNKTGELEFTSILGFGESRTIMGADSVIIRLIGELITF